MNEQELNKKLAEWAGFYQSDETPLGKCDNGAKTWYAPDYHWIGGHLSADFPHSLDACFKWLVPKAVGKICEYLHCADSVAYQHLFRRWTDELMLTSERPNSLAFVVYPALALCLAIEKLIDSK